VFFFRPPVAAGRLANTLGANMSPRSRLLRLVVILAAVHQLLALGSLATSYTLGMSRFDAGEFREPSAIERVATGASNVLFQPVIFILGVLGPGSHSTLVQWFAFGGNSLLWGLAVALLFWRLTQRSTRTPTGGPSAPPPGPVNLVR
jgi:hypothetical protein